MYYVYIIQSINHSDQIYVGCTENLEKRLSNHNCGTTPHTEKFKPWKIIVYIAFDQKDKAYEFEKYLKSGSGREFRKKRLLAMSNDTNNLEFSVANANKFINFVKKRFGVYLDTMQGLKLNLKHLDDAQLYMSQICNMSLQDLDNSNIIYGKGNPSSDLEEFSKVSLHKRTQKQFKIDNSSGQINAIFAIHNCLSDIYNQWKLSKINIGIYDDNEIPVIAYIQQIRIRTQHELYDDINSIKANIEIEIEMKQQLSAYKFPRFNKGDSIILTDEDCIALIQEIRQQLYQQK